ncbi:hypothetical protein VT84_13185 [Gemmata sp. SH-PL17]|nr:hypothetical protein VT84_13185 [Gemmata sp. SH-PL17]
MASARGLEAERDILKRKPALRVEPLDLLDGERATEEEELVDAPGEVRVVPLRVPSAVEARSAALSVLSSRAARYADAGQVIDLVLHERDER